MGNTTIPAELVAINAIQGTLIADNAITAVHIGQNQVHSVQLAINSVTATQIADGTITSAKIQDGAIATADIADVQITTAKLADNSVTSAKIVNASIVSADIANNAILTQHIDDNQITADQIADNAVGLGQMAGLTRGSIIYGDSAGDPAYLAAGTSGHVLTSDGTDISWTADTDLFLASSGGTVSGGVNIGSYQGSVVNAPLDIKSDTNHFAISIEENSGTETWQLGVNADGDLNFYDSGNSTPIVTFSDSNNIGIGETDPDNKLDVNFSITGEGSQDGGIKIHNVRGIDNDIAPLYFGVHGGTRRTKAAIGLKREGSYGIGPLIFALDSNGDDANVTFANDEKMRIDGSGNLLVGKTVADNTTVGIRLLGSSGFGCFVRDGNTPVVLNRLSNDGEILRFDKNSLPVGTIGTANSGDLYIGNDDTTLLFAGGSDAIIPRGTAGAARDGAISLGLSSHRFNNLHLSGTGYFGTAVGIGTTNASKSLSVKAPSGSNGGIDVLHSNGNIVAELVHSGSGDEGRLSLLDSGSTTVKFMGETGQDSFINSGKLIIGDTASHVDDLLQIENPASGGGHGIQIRRNDSNNDQIVGRIMFGNNTDTDLAQIHAKTDGSTDNASLIFSTQPNGGALTERLRIDSGGNINFLGSSPEFHFGTTSSSHHNWRIAVQEDINGGFQIDSGTESAGSGAADDTYTRRFAIRAADGHVGIKNDGNSTYALTVTGETQSLGFYSYGYTQLGAHIDGRTGDTVRISGTGLAHSNGNRYGNYGSLIFSSSGNWTSSARSYLITNGYDANRFAIIQSTSASNQPDITTANSGAVTNGNVVFEIQQTGDSGFRYNLNLKDNKYLGLGESNDARISFDGGTDLNITAVNGTANNILVSANNIYHMQANGTQMISCIANSEVVVNNDSSASMDFRVETDNEQYGFFVDASSEIVHFGEGTNSDMRQVIPAGTLAGRRHGYHGGNRTHAGQTFKYCEGTSWTDAIKIDWNNASWGGVCMRITGQYYYSASNNFSIVIGFAGYNGYGSVSYDATSSGVLNWTSAIQLAQTANGETMIRQRAGDSTGDVVYRYEWQTYNRSDQTILIVEQ